MDTQSKKIYTETPPVTDLDPLPTRNRLFIELCRLYEHNVDDLFWVLHNIRLKIQNDEASHMANNAIQKARYE